MRRRVTNRGQKDLSAETEGRGYYHTRIGNRKKTNKSCGWFMANNRHVAGPTEKRTEAVIRKGYWVSKRKR